MIELQNHVDYSTVHYSDYIPLKSGILTDFTPQSVEDTVHTSAALSLLSHPHASTIRLKTRHFPAQSQRPRRLFFVALYTSHGPRPFQKIFRSFRCFPFLSFSKTILVQDHF